MSNGKNLDYHVKYQDLRANFLAATDRAYAAGYEHGQRDATQQAMQQQQEAQQQADMQQAQMQSQGQPGMEDQTAGQEQDPADQFSEQPDMAQQADEGALEQQEGDFESKLNELESLLTGGVEVDKTEAAKVISQLTKSLRSVREIKSRMELRKSLQLQPLHKTERMKKLGKKVKTVSQNFQFNVDTKKKQAVSMQKTMVNDIIAKMKKEEEGSVESILKTIKGEGL